MHTTKNRVKLLENCTAKGIQDPGPWSLEEFKRNFRIDISHLDDSLMEFDMVGIDAPLANAFRRILLAEVPTMAISQVCIYNNTSLVADEVLAHRLGLIPIKADPRLFEYYKNGDEKTAQDSIQFNLKIKCTINLHAGISEDPNDKYINHKVFSGHMKWIPIGDQASVYSPGDIKPVDDNILLAVLKPGQEIDIVMYCHKGIGKDHAKYSPVATAFYRQMPVITLTKLVEGDAAYRLQKLFTPGVIEVQNRMGVPTAVVAHPRRDRGSRNALNDPEFKNCVQIERLTNHFIFSVESTGCLPPDVLVSQAVMILTQKCDEFIRKCENIRS